MPPWVRLDWFQSLRRPISADTTKTDEDPTEVDMPLDGSTTAVEPGQVVRSGGEDGADDGLVAVDLDHPERAGVVE